MLLQSKKTVTAAPDTTLLIIGFSPCDPIPGHIKANSFRALNRFQAPQLGDEKGNVRAGVVPCERRIADKGEELVAHVTKQRLVS